MVKASIKPTENNEENAVPIHESPAEAFSRLGTKRVKNVLKHVRLVSNLSNRGSYEYTPDQVDAIFNTIDKAVAEAKAKFSGQKELRSEDLFSV